MGPICLSPERCVTLLVLSFPLLALLAKKGAQDGICSQRRWSTLTPLLPTPVMHHRPCDSSVLSRGWLSGSWEEKWRRGGKLEAGTAALGKATLRPRWRASHGREKAWLSLHLHPIPRAQPGRPTAMTRLGCCLTVVGVGHHLHRFPRSSRGSLAGNFRLHTPRICVRMSHNPDDEESG